LLQAFGMCIVSNLSVVHQCILAYTNKVSLLKSSHKEMTEKKTLHQVDKK